MKTFNIILYLLLSWTKASETHDDTALLIKAVADWYGVNCVVVFRSESLNIRETEEIFHILRLVAYNMDMVQIEDLETRGIAYRHNPGRCSKMLHVVDERSSSSPSNLEQLSYSMDLSGPTWLIFLPNNTSSWEYLKHTYVPFNAEFIVAEAREYAIRLHKVYRVSMSHPLRITPFGYWAEDKKLVLDEYSSFRQRNDFEGKVFRVSAIENWPLTVVSGTTIGGFFGMIWRDLEERLNFTTAYVKHKGSGIGVWNGKEWTGLIGMIARNEIDAAISEVTMTTGRLSVVDYLLPLYVTRYQLFFKPPGLLIQWDMIFRPFTTEVWLVLMLWFGCTTILLVISHRIGVAYGLEDSKFNMEYHCSFLIVSAFCLQAVDVMPKSICCRFIVATTYLFSTVIVIIYSCTLTSMIATKKPVRPFDSLESFLKDGTYSLVQIPGSDSYTYFSNSTDHVLQEIYKNLFSKLPEEELPKSHKSALTRVCKNKKTAHFGEFGVAVISANQLLQNEECPIIVLQRSLKLLHMTMALTKDSPFREALNYQLSEMLNTGVLSRLRYMNFPLWGRTQKVSVQPVPVEQVIHVNLLLLIAVILSVFVFLLELIKSRI